MDADVSSLVGFAADAAGEHLRAVAAYTDDGAERWAYRHPRYEGQYTEGTLEAVANVLRDDGHQRSREEWAFLSGEQRASVRVFPNVITVHLRKPDGGVLLTLDTAVAANLAAFVADCHGALDG